MYFQIKSQLNLSTGEFQSLTGQLDDVNCLLVVIDKLVSLQVVYTIIPIPIDSCLLMYFFGEGG